MRSTSLFVLLLATIPLIYGATTSGFCGFNETAGSNPNEFTAPREYRYYPTVPADTTQYYQNIFKVLQFNIHSTYDITCTEAVDKQLALVKQYQPHFFAIQEVDVNVSTRCNCNQPQYFANATGNEVAFFRTFFFENGMYGHAVGSVYTVESIASHLFTNYSTEMRGVIAQVISPPQFGTRKLLLVGNHYQFDSEPTRQGQAMETITFVQGLLQTYPDAVVIMPGDYYTELGTDSYEILLGYFNNSWNDFHGSGMGGETYRSDVPKNRFDHIWYKVPAGFDMKVQTVQIIDSQLSDHRPLLTTFSLPASFASDTVTTTSSTTSSSTTSTVSVSISLVFTAVLALLSIL